MRVTLVIGMLVAVGMAGCNGAPSLTPDAELKFLMDAEELTQARPWPGEPGEYAVMQRDGIMYHLSGPGATPTKVLNMQGELSHAFTENEYGFKSFDFHPNFLENGMVFMGYTDDEKHSVIARFFADPSDPTAEWEFGDQLLRVDYSTTPYHNVAELQFGPDGMLYMTMGDPSRVRGAQYLDTVYGKMLRLDVDGDSGYHIPGDNPFVNDGDDETLPEIWLYGMRNPWRFDFDDEGGLWIADTGQSQMEEVSIYRPGDSRNFGWPWKEGTTDYRDNTNPSAPYYSPTSTPSEPLNVPYAEYSHENWCAIVGGVHYNGIAFEGLQGHFIAAEHCFSVLRVVDGALFVDWLEVEQDRINSVDEDQDGELLISTRLGRLHRVIPA